MARTLRSVMVFVCLVASTSLIASDLIPLGTDGTTVRDMVNMLRQERENRRARQVFEWEAVRRRSDVQASAQHYARR